MAKAAIAHQHRYFRTVQLFLYTVSINPEFLAKFTSAGIVAIAVLIKLFYGESTLCTGPRLNFKLNAIHGHATWQHHSPSPAHTKNKKNAVAKSPDSLADPV